MITHFVTGGSGYVGRNIIRRLKARGDAVKALARSETALAAVAALGAEPVRGDMMDKASFASGMAGCDTLVHAAADTSHGVVESDQLRTNVEGARNVFLAAREAGIRRAVHVSTESVLLSGRPLANADETVPYPRRFAGSYSESKAIAEQSVLALSSDAMPVIVIRPRFVWGRDDSRALPQLVDAARTGKLVWIGGGSYLTSTAHIDNVAEGVALALEKGRGGEIYFITDGPPHTFREFATRLLIAVGVDVPDAAAPRWLVRGMVSAGSWLERASGGRFPTMLNLQEYATAGVEVTLDISKAERELGYRPVTTLEQGLTTLQLP